jgi:hypothetical protein
MNLDDLTLGQVKQLQSVLGSPQAKQSLPLKVGENYFIRTVTMYYTGKVKEILGDAVVLSDACWIADTGRFYDFLASGKHNEAEPFVDDVIIPIGSIVDCTSWKHALIRVQK